MEMLFVEMKQWLLCCYLAKKGHRISRKMHTEEMHHPVDFVVTWVDGADPKWKAEKEKYQRAIGIFKDHRDNGEERYRDWDIFRYWFRAVEKYAPWVRNVYLITEGHVPEWLNLECPKLKHIKHSDYIPAEYLPTFNSNVIELNMHRIEGLAEHFVYFNDDMFLTRPCKPEDFFSAGKPNATAMAIPLRNDDNSAFRHSLFSNLGAINRIYSGHVVETIKKNPEIWYHKDYGYEQMETSCSIKTDHLQGMYFSHCPTAFRKSTFDRVWEVFLSELKDTSSHRFRTPQDVMHQLVTIWDIMHGDIYPVSPSHHGKLFFHPSKQLPELLSAIQDGTELTICINDSEHITYAQYLDLKDQIADVMENTLSQKSMFEK